MKIKIIKSDNRAQPNVLNLKEVEEMFYKCTTTGIEIIDCNQELQQAQKLHKEQGLTRFWETTIFNENEQGLNFITEFEIIND